MTADAGAPGAEGAPETGGQASPETGQQPPSPPAETAGEAGEATDWQKEAEKWKALSKKNELRARENSAAAAKLAQLEDANKTELQRAIEKAEKAERERAEERAERHRLLAAASYGLGPDFVDFLGTGEEDDIYARAEVLNKHIEDEVTRRVQALTGGMPNGAPTAAAAASLALGRRPAESLRPGSIPQSQQRNTNDPNEIFRQIIQGPH